MGVQTNSLQANPVTCVCLDTHGLRSCPRRARWVSTRFHMCAHSRWGQRIALKFGIALRTNQPAVAVFEGPRSLMRLMNDDGIADAERIRIGVSHHRSARIVNASRQNVATEHRRRAVDPHESEWVRDIARGRAGRYECSPVKMALPLCTTYICEGADATLAPIRKTKLHCRTGQPARAASASESSVMKIPLPCLPCARGEGPSALREARRSAVGGRKACA